MPPIIPAQKPSFSVDLSISFSFPTRPYEQSKVIIFFVNLFVCCNRIRPHYTIFFYLWVTASVIQVFLQVYDRYKFIRMRQAVACRKADYEADYTDQSVCFHFGLTFFGLYLTHVSAVPQACRCIKQEVKFLPYDLQSLHRFMSFSCST